MVNDFWDDVEECVRHQGKIAVYSNAENYVLIRQKSESNPYDFEDSVIFVEPENVDVLVRALLKVKEEILSSREGS